jgi:hypothetical protein
MFIILHIEPIFWHLNTEKNVQLHLSDEINAFM